MIFAFLLQVVVAGQINFPSFVDDGMGYSKLHAITSLFLFESVVVLILYLQAPDLKKGICLSILLSFLGGIQLLGLVVLVALGAALLIQGVRLHWKTAGLSLALTVPWYLKTWFQVGCPFPAGIAPFWLTNLFLSNLKFYPRFYHHHFIYLFQFENEALSRVRVPFQGLANLMAQSPFNLLLPASLFLWAVRFPGMDKKGNRNFLFAAYLVLAALILNHPNPRYFIYFFPFLAVCFLALAEASSAFLRRFVKTESLAFGFEFHHSFFHCDRVTGLCDSLHPGFSFLFRACGRACFFSPSFCRDGEIHLEDIPNSRPSVFAHASLGETESPFGCANPSQ